MLILETKLTFIFIKRFSTQKSWDKSLQILSCEIISGWVCEMEKVFVFFFASTKHTWKAWEEILIIFNLSWLLKVFPVVEWWKVFPLLLLPSTPTFPFVVVNPHINDDFSKKEKNFASSSLSLSLTPFLAGTRTSSWKRQEIQSDFKENQEEERGSWKVFVLIKTDQVWSFRNKKFLDFVGVAHKLRHGS